MTRQALAGRLTGCGVMEAVAVLDQHLSMLGRLALRDLHGGVVLSAGGVQTPELCLAGAPGALWIALDGQREGLATRGAVDVQSAHLAFREM